MEKTVTELLAGCFRTDQKCPYLHTNNKNKLFVMDKNVGLCLSREGVIIECPLNGQFHDALDVILRSRNDVRGFAGDNDDDEPTLGTLITRYKSF